MTDIREQSHAVQRIKEQGLILERFNGEIQILQVEPFGDVTLIYRLTQDGKEEYYGKFLNGSIDGERLNEDIEALKNAQRGDWQ